MGKEAINYAASVHLSGRFGGGFFEGGGNQRDLRVNKGFLKMDAFLGP